MEIKSSCVKRIIGSENKYEHPRSNLRTWNAPSHCFASWRIGNYLFARKICFGCPGNGSSFWFVSSLWNGIGGCIFLQPFWVRNGGRICRPASQGFWVPFPYRRFGGRNLFFSCQGSMAGLYGLILCCLRSGCCLCR